MKAVSYTNKGNQTSKYIKQKMEPHQGVLHRLPALRIILFPFCFMLKVKLYRQMNALFLFLLFTQNVENCCSKLCEPEGGISYLGYLQIWLISDINKAIFRYLVFPLLCFNILSCQERWAKESGFLCQRCKNQIKKGFSRIWWCFALEIYNIIMINTIAL